MSKGRTAWHIIQLCVHGEKSASALWKLPRGLWGNYEVKEKMKGGWDPDHLIFRCFSTFVSHQQWYLTAVTTNWKLIKAVLQVGLGRWLQAQAPVCTMARFYFVGSVYYCTIDLRSNSQTPLLPTHFFKKKIACFKIPLRSTVWKLQLF